MKHLFRLFCVWLFVGASASADEAAGPFYVPYRASGIYALGETAGWYVTLPWSSPAATYVIRKNNLAEIGRGQVTPGKPSTIEAKLDEPGMVYVEITENAPGAKPRALGAAVAPERIQPSIPAPPDFDAFWAEKIKQLREVPAAPELAVAPSEKDGVDFAILKMNHVNGGHVWGQVAKPHDATNTRKYPGLLILQWASPPYPLQKKWVTDRAAEGWLTVNIEPHDVMPDQPKEYYDALPASLKQYHAIETRDRDKNYFLQMYLADIRAADYLASRPDWDGKTLVVMGTSMGGQQSFCTAALHPKVTAMLVNVPAGADANGTAHGRKTGYPHWDPKDPKALETGQYFDTVNCAARVKVPSLVAMGFIDTLTPPVGIWAAFNQLRGLKEAAPMPDSPHNHLATAEQLRPWTQRSVGWLKTLVEGRSPIESVPEPAPASDKSEGPAKTYENPILHSDYSDPDVIRVGKRYLMTASTFSFSPGLPVLESRDLVHWTLIAHALPRLPFHANYDLPGPLGFNDESERARFNPQMGHRYGQGVWAPAIRFHRGRYYIYVATPTEGIFMVSAKKPEGPWEAPVTVVNEPGLEDPCPFWDDDGNAYLVHSKVGAGPLILRRLSADGRKALDAGKVIVEDPQNLPTLEGPKLLKRNGWYYIFAPYGGVEKGPQAVVRSRNIYGPYEARTVLAQGQTTVQAPHQGGYVETPSGQGWFAHFNSTGAYGRIVHLQPVIWRDDWPFIGEPTPGSATTGQPVKSHAVPDVGGVFPPVFPQSSDEFKDKRLGLQWEWNHNPVNAQWSLNERRGFLRLKAMPAPDFLSARNTLTQVLHGSASQTTIRLDVSGLVDGQRAGLAMLQVQPNWIGVVQTAGERRLVSSSAGVQIEGPLLGEATVQLRLDVERETVSYSYSLDEGRTFLPLGGPFRLRFSWWKGSRPALFSFSQGPPPSKSGHADFDWVHVTQVAPVRK
jgi:beta-xylosidase/cephalosporin-C deacetylase-like acetyl esterase